MADAPEPVNRPRESALVREIQARATRAETFAMGCFGLGILLLLIGVVIWLLRGGGWICLWLGGVIFLTGCIENTRAEIRRLRAKLEKD